MERKRLGFGSIRAQGPKTFPSQTHHRPRGLSRCLVATLRSPSAVCSTLFPPLATSNGPRSLAQACAALADIPFSSSPTRMRPSTRRTRLRRATWRSTSPYPSETVRVASGRQSPPALTPTHRQMTHSPQDTCQSSATRSKSSKYSTGGSKTGKSSTKSSQAQNSNAAATNGTFLVRRNRTACPLTSMPAGESSSSRSATLQPQQTIPCPSTSTTQTRRLHRTGGTPARSLHSSSPTSMTRQTSSSAVRVSHSLAHPATRLSPRHR